MTDTSIILQPEPARKFQSEIFTSKILGEVNYFRSYVETPHHIVYTKGSSYASQPYSIFLHGEIAGYARSTGSTHGPMYVEIDIYVSVFRRDAPTETVYDESDIIESWVSPPDGFLKWDHVERYGTQTAANYSYSFSVGAKIEYASFGVGFSYRPNATVEYRAKNDEAYDGEYRRLVRLRSQHDFNKPHEFSAQVRLLLNNKMANEYDEGKVVNERLHRISAIRVRTKFNFFAQTKKIYTHTLGDGSDNDYPELPMLPGTINITLA